MTEYLILLWLIPSNFENKKPLHINAKKYFSIHINEKVFSTLCLCVLVLKCIILFAACVVWDRHANNDIVWMFVLGMDQMLFRLRVKDCECDWWHKYCLANSLHFEMWCGYDIFVACVCVQRWLHINANWNLLHINAWSVLLLCLCVMVLDAWTTS